MEQEQLRAGEARNARSCPQMATAQGARAVASMRNVALVSLEPASAEMNGVQVMARALDAMARADVEVLARFQFQLPAEFLLPGAGRRAGPVAAGAGIGAGAGVGAPVTSIRSQVDRNVGLLAAVGEGMQGKPGLAGRIFTAISRVQVNIIAIAQGSSELTIAVVVRRDGLEKAVKAVHAECGLGMPSAGPGVYIPDGAAARGVGSVRDSPFRYNKSSPFRHRSSATTMFDLFRSRDKAVRILLGALAGGRGPFHAHLPGPELQHRRLVGERRSGRRNRQRHHHAAGSAASRPDDDARPAAAAGDSAQLHARR